MRILLLLWCILATIALLLISSFNLASATSCFQFSDQYVKRIGKEDGLPFLMSHRGSRYFTAENTIRAFHSVLELGTHVLEMDVRLTKDNQLVVFHDATLNRTTNYGDVPIRNLTVAELQSEAIDAAYHFEPNKDGVFPLRGLKSPGEVRIPLFREVLAEFWGEDRSNPNDIYINIEIKDDIEAAAEELYKELSVYDIDNFVSKHTLVVSVHCKILNHFREVSQRKIPTGACEQEATQFFVLSMLKSLVRSIFSSLSSVTTTTTTKTKTTKTTTTTLLPVFGRRRLDAVEEWLISKIGSSSVLRLGNSTDPRHPCAYQLPTHTGGVPIATAETIAEAHAQGREIHFWVVNDRREFRRLLDLGGVDAIITDRIDIAVQEWREGKPKRELRTPEWLQFLDETFGGGGADTSALKATEKSEKQVKQEVDTTSTSTTTTTTAAAATTTRRGGNYYKKYEVFIPRESPEEIHTCITVACRLVQNIELLLLGAALLVTASTCFFMVMCIKCCYRRFFCGGSGFQKTKTE